MSQLGQGAKLRLSPTALQDRLLRLPRVHLATVPTPIHELPHLSRELGVRVLVKRDDLTGLAFGGNKIRQLEFFMGEATAAGCDVIIAGGSFAQSNHARACAAAARAAGLQSIILLRPGGGTAGALTTGNALITSLLADDVRVVDALADVPRGDRLGEVRHRGLVFDEVASEVRNRGRKPYVLPGSSTPLGVMGYMAAAIELHEQCHALDIHFSKLFVTSLGVTHAGLELGHRLLGDPYDVIGIAYQPTGGAATAWICRLIDGAGKLLGLEFSVRERDVVNDDTVAGPEYGMLNESARDALSFAARQDALLLDPIYGAKGFAGLLKWVREGRVEQGETVVFLHTGGLPAIFAYGDQSRAGAQAGFEAAGL